MSATAEPTKVESSQASLNETVTVDSHLDEKTLKRAHSKVDHRLLFWYSFVYLIMRVHVGNISNTAIMNLEQGTGIKKQLGNLTPGQWAWVLSIFYYPYMVFEPISTLALKAFTPRKWMSRIMITWVGWLGSRQADSRGSSPCAKERQQTTRVSLPAGSSSA